MPTAPKTVKFKAILTKPTAESGWHFIPVQEKIGSRFEKKDGSRRVVCTINGAETFQCALIPMGEIFAIIVNKSKRDKLSISAGDTVSVELRVDASKYGLPMPEELREVLNQDAEGDKLFHSLTAGKQRSMLYFIGKIKDVDKRIHAALIFIEHIKKNEGKIIYESLTNELKRPIF